MLEDIKDFSIIDLTNNSGMEIKLTDWGASWISCKVPLKTGGEIKKVFREVLLGCKIEDYPNQNAYLGATIGRYANRIANAQFFDGNKIVKLTANQGNHQLHGGRGFSHRRWEIKNRGVNSVSFEIFSPDGDQGFPGNCTAQIKYTLSDENYILIEFNAICDQYCPLNFTNHSYFNLDNAIEGCDIRNHFLQLNSDYFLPVDSCGIPNAPLKMVANTSFDFRNLRKIKTNFLEDEQVLTQGYDHSFLLCENSTKPAARLISSDQKLELQIFTSKPAIGVYTGNFIGKTPNRLGKFYENYSGIALETQFLPDSPNHPEWANFCKIFPPNNPYFYWTKFQF